METKLKVPYRPRIVHTSEMGLLLPRLGGFRFDVTRAFAQQVVVQFFKEGLVRCL